MRPEVLGTLSWAYCLHPGDQRKPRMSKAPEQGKECEVGPPNTVAGDELQHSHVKGRLVIELIWEDYVKVLGKV